MVAEVSDSSVPLLAGAWTPQWERLREMPVVPEVPVLQWELQEQMGRPVLRLVAAPMVRLAAARVLVAGGSGPTRELQALALLWWASMCFPVQPRTTVRQVAAPERWVRMVLAQRVRLWDVFACHSQVAQRASAWQSSQERRQPGAVRESVLDEQRLAATVLDEQRLAATVLAAISVVDVVELAIGALRYPALPQRQALGLAVPPRVVSSLDWPHGPRLGRWSGCLPRRLHHALRLGQVGLAG